MKHYLPLFIALALSFNLAAQHNEFEIYPNGLIYSKSTMNQLSTIVDSLNLKYKSCELDREFRSKSQAVGNHIELRENNVEDIENQISYDDFVTKYPDAKVKKDILIVRYLYESYNKEAQVDFSEVTVKSSYSKRILLSNNNDLYSQKLVGCWILNYEEESDYCKESISAFFFPKGFKADVIPERYARMIGYADCLIDTTAPKLLEDGEPGWVALPKNWKKLSKAKQEVLLETMRRTRVMGQCSMDDSPRTHAINIAVLSAQTTNWEVFLKAHLDIMNDRFDRISDGSYAWAARNTYIRELEQLEINVADLVFGISLRIENPAEFHYFGSVGRLGRALSETKNSTEMEQIMLTMIEDSELDDYNRIIAYFLFINYNHYIEDESIKSENLEQLKNSVALLPQHLKSEIEFEEE
jgi:hypothetical protein